MSHSISKILEVHIDDDCCTVTAIIEDMVQISPASSWGDPPHPAEYGPATCIGGFDINDYVLPAELEGRAMELLCESIDMGWEILED